MIRKKKPIQSISKRHFLRCVQDDITKQRSLTNQNIEDNIRSPEQPSLDVDSPNYSEPNTIIIPVPSDQLTTNNEINHDDIFDQTTFVDNNKNNSLHEKLKNWVFDFHVTHNCVNALLVILRSEGLKLPKDTRTLLKTPKTGDHNITSVHPGSYIHLGVKFMLNKFISPHIDSIENNFLVKLSFNVDGVPLSSSSKSSFWPILVSFINVPYLNKTVIPVGLYHGKFKKPTSSFEFLNIFNTEIMEVITNGLIICNKTLWFEIGQVICDAPAKAFLLNVKGHNAYHGCNSCIVEGTYINHRMAYLEMNATLRSNCSFREKKDEFYHKDSSPLEDLPIDITSVVVLEYMHNVCLGVMKRLILFWVKGKKPVRLLDPESVSEELINLKPFLPREFSRLPRTLEECEFWKATEFRTFLIYTGPIVLKGRLKKKLYEHFMLLSCAIRILISPETCFSLNNMAKNLLKEFVQDYPNYYGEEYVGYNVHGLLHITDFVLIHGPLDAFSAFKFENYLQFVKRSSNNSRYPLQDLYNRIMEKISIESCHTSVGYPILKNELNYDASINYSLNETLYEEVVLEKFVVSSKNIRDNIFILQNHDVVKINKIIKYIGGKIKFEVNKYTKTSMFQSPVPSDIIQIFYLNEICPIPTPVLIELDSLKYKCFVTPIVGYKFVAIALLHEV